MQKYDIIMKQVTFELNRRIKLFNTFAMISEKLFLNRKNAMKFYFLTMTVLLLFASLANSRSLDYGGVLKKAVDTESNLPLVVIQTNGQTIVDEPKIIVNIKVIDNGPGKTNSVTDAGNQYDGLAGIEIRGQSSQYFFPKKSYGFETRNILGDDVKVSLMGMPEESDWVLYAPYSDKTMLRNALTYYLGRKMGRWQPGFRFCEVYLNGSYIGIYQLTEKIKRDKERVNISKMSATDISGNGVTGGYIVKVDKLNGLSSSDYFTNYAEVRFSNARNYAWTWVYPKTEDLLPQQKTWLISYIKNVENTINGASFAESSTGYRKYLEVPSFIDFQIINELANNVDGYRYSTFFYKQRDSEGGKFVAGPLWDFDICYGNVDYSSRNLAVNQWEYANYGLSDWNCMHWWARLMMDPQYVKELKQRWSQLRRGILQTDSIMDYIDSRILLLGNAVGRNYSKWNILGTYVWPNSEVRYTYTAEVKFLKDWITRRLEWMDSQWLVTSDTISGISGTGISIYPNPVSRILNIKISGNRNCSIGLYDLRGTKLLSKETVSDSSGKIQIDFSQITTGVYILEIIRQGCGTEIIKVVKTR